MENGADENSNSSFSPHLRKRKNSKASSLQEKKETQITENTEHSPKSNPDDDEATRNAAVYQQIALTRIKNHAMVCTQSVVITLIKFIELGL